MSDNFYDSMLIYLNAGYVQLDDVISIYQCCQQCSHHIAKNIISLISSSSSSSSSLSSLLLNNITKFNIKELLLYNTSSFNENILDTIMNISSITTMSLHQLYLSKFTLTNNSDSSSSSSGSNSNSSKSSIHSLDLTLNLLNSDVLVDMLYYYSSTKLHDLKILVLDDSLQLIDKSIQNIIDIIPSLEILTMRRTGLISIEDLNHHHLQEISFENCFNLNKLTFEKTTTTNTNSLLKLDISWTCLTDTNLHDIIESCSHLKVLIVNYCLKFNNINITSSTLEELMMIGCLLIKTVKLRCKHLKILKVESCKNIEEIDLESNRIKELDLSMLQKLSILKLSVPSLTRLLLQGCKSLYASKKELMSIIKDCSMLNIDELIATCIEGSGISLILKDQNKKFLDTNNNNVYRPIYHRRSASV